MNLSYFIRYTCAILVTCTLLPQVGWSQKGEDLVQLSVSQFVAPSPSNDSRLLAVELNIQSQWHIYFHNPGDSGMATEFKFAPAQSFVMESWPMPETLKESGDLWTFAHQGRVFFFFRATDSKIWQLSELNIEITYLVCKELCIPGQKSLRFSPATLEQNKGEEVLAAWNTAPQEAAAPPTDFKWQLLQQSPDLWLTYQVPMGENFLDFHHYNLLVPHHKAAYSWGHEELRYDPQSNQLHGRIKIEWDGKYQDPPLALPAIGKQAPPISLKVNLNQTPHPQVVSLLIPEILPSSNAMSAAFLKLPLATEYFAGKMTTPPSPSVPLSSATFWTMLFFAFLGGLILNFMPCVLPVITLKLFHFAKYTSKPDRDFYLHNVWYTIGITASLLALGATIITLKNLGQSVGWGFQMQSPSFVFIMLLVLFFMTLNLFGLFEWSVLGGRLTKVRFQHDHLNHFWSGILTSALSTPCSAPILGTALTFAFSQEAGTILLIFFCIAMGLSSPFLLLSLFPGLLKKFPKPGAWMDVLKHFLGFSMLLSTVWLLEVLLELWKAQEAFWPLMTMLCALFFLIFLRKKKREYPKTIFFLSSFLLIYALKTTYLLFHPSMMSPLEWKPFNKYSEQTIRENHKITFVDFTAKWCITCQVNKKLVMETGDFADFVKEKNIEVYRADWTMRDPWITHFLQSHGAVSVPAYFLIVGEKTLFVGETISLTKLEEKLKSLE